MRELINNLLSRHYSTVHQSETNTEQNQRSLNSTRRLQRGFSVVDQLFQKREKSGKRWPTCVFLLMIGGLCMIGSGVIMHFYDPYDLIFRWKLQFDEGGEIFDLWRDPPVHIFCKVYLFNITNAEDFLAGRAEKMQVEEVGPYVYRELFLHDNVTFNDNDTVSAIPKHPLVWQPEMSPGRSEQDLLYLPNIALLSIAHVVADKSFFVRLPINMLVRQKNEQPIVKMTAREFMFGYETSITTLGNNLLPHWIYFDKVGLIDRMYDFNGDYETMYAGHTNQSLSGLIDTYNGSPDLPQWEGEHCSRIRYASDGVKFKSFVAENETLLFFRKSMCRAQRLIRVGNDSVYNGLTASKYVFEANALDNGETVEENKCFCRKGNCLPRGLIDVTECYYGFPIALSYPHFMDADSKIQNMTEGSTPDPKKHESFFLINRQSGLPLQISAKFQINMAMKDVSNMANVERFSNLVLPMLWFDISMDRLPNGLNNRFIFYLNLLPGFVQFCYFGSFIGGAILLTWAMVRVARTLNGDNKTVMMKNLNGGSVYRPCEEVKVECLDVIEENKKNDSLSDTSSSGFSSQTSSNHKNSLTDTQLPVLRIVEDYEQEMESAMMKLYRQHYNGRRSSSLESLSNILDQV